MPGLTGCTQYNYSVQTAPPAEVAAFIAAWRPRTVSEPVAAFTREVLTAAAPDTVGRAKAGIWALSRLAAYAVSVGLDLRAEVVLHPSVIERFAAAGPAGITPAARRTLRTTARWVARRVLPHPPPAPVALSRERAKPPYTPAQIAGYLALADAQPTAVRRMRLCALVCLGAGAGVIGADLRALRGLDVHRHGDALVVVVAGARARTVPVLPDYAERLAAAADFAGEKLLTGGVDTARRNLTDPLLGSLAGGADLPRCDTHRLRSTWLAACAQRIGLGAFLSVAGVVCTQRLGDIVAGLPAGDPEQAVALFGRPP